MLPSQPHLTGKRKPDDSNPLNAVAAKRAKKELLVSQPNLTGKRKVDDSNPLLVAAAAKRAKKEAKAPSFNPPPVPFSSINDDSEVEQDVRAMEDESDHLRRNSRAHTTIESPLLSRNPALQFGSNGESSNTSRSRGKTKITDISTPLPENETPQIKRNKQLREGAMAAIGSGRAQTPEVNGNDTRHRRKSSVNGRGKRISSSFEATGILYQPHNSVSDGSFYKHIDADLPDSERIRQLLIWSSLRAAATPTPSTSKTPSSSSQPALPPPPPLPPLSSKAVQTLKSVQEDIVKMLAEKRIDLSLYSPEAGSSTTKPEDLLENEQNARNRYLEVTYSDYIKRADAENEAWKEVGFKYKTYGEKLQASLQERMAASTSTETTRSETRNIVEMEAELDKRLGSALEFKIDQIFSYVSAARATTYIAEKALNERFDIIASNLKSRLNPHPNPHLPNGVLSADSGSGSSTQTLTTYVTNPQSNSTPSGGVGSAVDLMRALTRVDKERPPGMVGDAAWRAAREVQRVGESGVAAVGERRLTGIPVTPRKAPGTPRRGNTPGRDR
ncbi:hypothetical protein BYT27DRAFT_7258448 [Phlegmacium glaucopus]|nr:hypothetical protein BYT27DRAFT_7258448 [Phlegmacium glaucopus]